MTPNNVTPPSSNDPLALRREDLAGLVSSYNAALRGKKEWGRVFAAFGGLAGGVAFITIREHAGWPAPLDPVFFFLGWAVFLGFTANVIMRARRFHARYKIHCPACDASLLEPPSRGGGVTRAELAIATGCCPACGEHILAP